MMFLDSPVGTGYSYVENINLLVKNDEEAATDLTLSWGLLLKDVLDNNGLKFANRISQKIKQQIRAGLYLNATNSWSELEQVISQTREDSTSSADSKITAVRKYSAYLDSLRSINPNGAGDNYKDNLMDVIIRKKLKIIPNDILWGEQSGNVFQAMAADFMKPMINEVDELLAKGVNVTVYNGLI